MSASSQPQHILLGEYEIDGKNRELYMLVIPDQMWEDLTVQVGEYVRSPADQLLRSLVDSGHVVADVVDWSVDIPVSLYYYYKADQ